MAEPATTTPVTASTAKAAEAPFKLVKYENPKSIKELYVNNLLDAANRADQKYSGTNGQRDMLTDILRDQAQFSIQNDGFAFFDNKANEVYEKGLAAKGPDAAKKVAEHRLINGLGKIHNFPDDAKVAAEFTAIVTNSLNAAIDSRSTQLGQQVVVAPIKPVNVDIASEKAKELTAVGGPK